VTTYADSSALIPLYVSERFSDSAEAVLRRAGQLPFTVLHQLEVPNAFERLVGQRLMTREECDSVERQLRDDLDNQRLTRISLDVDAVFAQAVDFSKRYAAKHLARSLDLLHVAAAHGANCTRFVSADDRQLAVAKATGLKVVDIKQSVGGRKH
jgi:predicted nucleic acid-binding protein